MNDRWQCETVVAPDHHVVQELMHHLRRQRGRKERSECEKRELLIGSQRIKADVEQTLDAQTAALAEAQRRGQLVRRGRDLAQKLTARPTLHLQRSPCDLDREGVIA